MKKNFCSLSHLQLALGFTLLVSGAAIGQMRVITGTVTDNNIPLAGVSVFQQGSNAVAITNASGVYQVQVTGDDPVIIYRHPDFPERKITLGTRVSVNIALGSQEKAIEEVVLNAGYYKVRDKERTGSIAKVSAKDIENQAVTNVLSAAQGRVSGVSIVQNSGIPGGGYDVQIRGKNSLRSAGNAPLYVVDGVPVGGEMSSQFSGLVLPGSSINPLNSINPNDIESLEILKDADATSIYGSRGANGVILITTKKGKSGKLSLNFGTSYAVSSVINKLKMMNTAEYIAMRKMAYQNDGIVNYPPNAYDVNGVWDQNRDTDWTKLLIGNTADAFNSHLSLSGGNERTSFLVSYAHSEQSIVFSPEYQYKTNNLSSSIKHSSSDNRFQLNISNRFSIQKNNVVSEDITKRSFLISPNAPKLYNDNGSINWENNTFNNPVAIFNTTYSNQNIQFLNNINAQYELFDNLVLKFNGGINYQSFDERSLKPHTMYNPSTAQGQSSAYSQSSKNNQNRLSFILEPQLNWQLKKNQHKLDVLIGTTYQRDTNNQGSLVGLGFESNAFLENIGAAQTKIVSDQITTEYKYAAFFGRINYQFVGKYILNVTGRRDGSSRFGPNNKFANFGAVGTAWIFSEEGFLKDRKWLSFGKLRTSFGSTGSDNIGDYGYLDTYTVASSTYNSTTGLNPSRLYNPNYSWEKTTKLEAALEMGFLKNRINFITSWYNNRSSNQLVGYQLPATTGFSTVLANLNATVENSGWEFELSAKPFAGRTFQWEIGLNISFPKNKLISFPGLEGSTYANSYIIGQPTSIVKLYEFEGIDPATGIFKFRDFNGDGKISSPNDRQVVANIGVRYFGGWNNSLRYGNWNMSLLFQFVKQKNWNYNNIMPLPGSMNNQPLEALGVWSLENPQGAYMPYSSGSNGLKNQAQVFFTGSTAAVSDASFIRLKNIEIGYQLPLQNSVFKNVRLYCQGQNLLTFTSYFGIDPEFRTIGYLPPLKTYSFGVLVTL